MECQVCGMNFVWLGEEDPSILDHLKICCSSIPETVEDQTSSFRYELINLAW
jgi:hypothetical protein